LIHASVRFPEWNWEIGDVSLHLRAAVRSDAGPVRRDNEDAAYADNHVLALADGMGGHPAGDVAASLVVGPFGRRIDAPQWDVVDHLRAATLMGEDAIADYVAKNPEAVGMGTTLTAVRLADDRLGLLHVGDSRAYLLRDAVLYQLSHDDTLVQSLVDQGVLSWDEARVHPQRNVVVRALMGPKTRFSLASWTVGEHDRLLLCSDGLSDVLRDEELTEAVMNRDVESAAELLVGLALRRGATDNVTCIVADVVVEAREAAPILAGAAARPALQ
jgi:PPM family protein phosphatase